MLPEARKSRVVVETLGDEVLVYDLDTHQAHCLNPTAAAIWAKLDGTATLASLCAALTLEERVVLAGLEQLSEAGLLLGPLPVQTTMKRREMLKTIGKIAAVAPLVASITAPTPAMAASCVGKGSACTGGGSQGTCCAPFNCRGIPGGAGTCV